MPGVANYLVQRLVDAGARTLFGLPGGGGNLDLIEAAGRAGLPFVLTATETGSAIAAIAGTEIAGGVGACITTIGPGVTSVVNGVACASLDRAPLLVITDTYPESHATALLGGDPYTPPGSLTARGPNAPLRSLRFEHQLVDHQALLRPLVKWSGRLGPDRAFETVDVGMAKLAALPPGPVHFDCAGDFGKAERPAVVGTNARVETIKSQASDRTSGVLRGSRNPLFIVGLGARRAEDSAAICDLCERVGIPALVTYKAKGVVPDSHPWFAGVFTNGEIERTIVNESDLIIGVGFDPVEILPRAWTYQQPVISVAPWQMASSHVPFESQWVGPVAEALADLGRLFSASAWKQADVATQYETSVGRPFGDVGSNHRPGISDVAALRSGPLSPSRVVQLLAEHFAKSARVTVDAGAHMFPATMLWPAVRPGDLLISNGLSTMGFALPAAIGAGVVDRDRPVIALTGDGGLLICLGELATAVRERLKIVVVVFKDASLSLIEIKQLDRRLPSKGVQLGDLDWVRIAEGFGLPAWAAVNERELTDAIGRAAGVDGPTLIEARIDASNYGSMLKAIRG